MANVTSKTVVKLLIRRGNNPSDTEKMVKKHYDQVRRMFKGQNLTNGKIADIIRTIY